MRNIFTAILTALVAGLAPAAFGAGMEYGDPPPATNYVVHNGLDWIWASPCATNDPSCGKPGPLPLNGFEEPTQNDWAGWTDRAELIAAFLPGNVQICGSPWMSADHSHCDTSDLENGHIYHAFANGICDPAYFDGCEAATTESFLVRPHAAPEPATLALVLSGVGFAGWVSRRRQQARRT